MSEQTKFKCGQAVHGTYFNTPYRGTVGDIICSEPGAIYQISLSECISINGVPISYILFHSSVMQSHTMLAEPPPVKLGPISPAPENPLVLYQKDLNSKRGDLWNAKFEAVNGYPEKYALAAAKRLQRSDDMLRLLKIAVGYAVPSVGVRDEIYDLLNDLKESSDDNGC